MATINHEAEIEQARAGARRTGELQQQSWERQDRAIQATDLLRTGLNRAWTAAERARAAELVDRDG